MTEVIKPMGKILVGIAGWSYPDWKGLVFPRETQFNRLEYLSHYFNTVEINTSFYSIPSLKVVDGWLRSVQQNSEFSFAIKMYKQLTHGEDTQNGRPEIVESTIRAFKQVLEPLRGAGKLGALLLQFPYRFHDSSEARKYLCALLDVFQEYPLVVEVRHQSFAHPSFYQLLRERQVAFANIDQPDVSANLKSTGVFTSSHLSYLRFHGRNAANWFASEAGRDGRYDYDYSAEELEGYLEMIREFHGQGGTLYVIFNNHYRAAEVKNALEFLHQMTGEKVLVMPKLLKAYPSLEAIALPSTPEKIPTHPGENYSLF
jgi:uncharacterized protein YecE (DUF72 family)